MFAHASTSWYYMNAADTRLVYSFQTATWVPLSGTGLAAAGWSYYDWPYACSLTDGSWYYVGGDGGTQWCCNLTSGAWTTFGAAETSDFVGTWMGHAQYQSTSDNHFGPMTLVCTSTGGAGISCAMTYQPETQHFSGSVSNGVFRGALPNPSPLDFDCMTWDVPVTLSLTAPDALNFSAVGTYCGGNRGSFTATLARQ